MDAAQELAQMEELAALEAKMKGAPAAAPAPQEKGMLQKILDFTGTTLEDVKKYGPGFLKEQGGNLARGALSAVDTVNKGISQFGPPMMRAPFSAMTATPSTSLAPPIDPNESPTQNLLRRTVEGAGSALVNPVTAGQTGIVRGLANSGLTGAMGGASGEMAGRFADNAGLNPTARSIAELIGSITGGGLTGFALGPKQSVGQRDIRKELEHTPASQWNAADRNVDSFANAGTTTGTAAELFPGRTGIAALAAKAANSKGGEELGARLSQRDADLSSMGLRLPGTIGPNVSIPETARMAAEAAARRQGQLKAAAQRPLNMIGRDELNGRLPAIPEQNMAAAHRNYENLTNMPGQPAADVTAHQGFLPEFLDVNAPPRQVMRPGPLQPSGGRNLTLAEEPGFQRQLSSLMLNMAENSKRETGANATAAQTIPKRASTVAQRDAFEALNLLPAPHGPRAAQASADYLARKEAWVTPAEEGTLGKISGNKNVIKGPVSEGKLDAVLSDTTPGATAEVLRQLEKGGGNRRDIATALVQSQLENAPTNYPKVVAGEAANSPKQNQLMELIGAAGGNTGRAGDILNTGRQLQGLSGPSGRQGFPEMRTGQLLLRPLRTLDMMVTGQGEKGIQREIAHLLANPTRESLQRLREIAMFDPSARAALSAQGAITPWLSNSQKDQ